MALLRVLSCLTLVTCVSALRRSSRRAERSESGAATTQGEQQYVRLVKLKADNTDTIISAAKTMATDAASSQPGCLRFDVMQRATDTTWESLENEIWLFAVFEDKDASVEFTGSEIYKAFLGGLDLDVVSVEQTSFFTPAGIKTQMAPKDDDYNPALLWFYGTVKTMAERDQLQSAFRAMLEPTRGEEGNHRYDQAIPESDDDLFMIENIWYKDLDAQTVHMTSSWMGTFFVDAPPDAIWDQIPLKVLASERGTYRSYIQYTYITDHALIASTQPAGVNCDYWRPEDLGKKVDDVCCDPSKWGEAAKAHSAVPDARTAPGDMTGEQYSCYVRERNAPNQGTYIRNFFGCSNGQIQANEGCAPTGTSMGHGYPMNETFAVKYSEEGSPGSCNCDEPAYVGEGCFVALTGYIAGVSPDPTANFLKVVGTCA